MSFEAVVLSEVLRVKHGYAFKGKYFEPAGEKLVLTPGNFAIGGGIQLRDGKERYYHGSYPAEFDLRPGDLLVAMTDLTQGAPILGSPITIPADGRHYLNNQRLGKIEIDSNRLDCRFAYYMFVWDGVRAQLRASATGATVRHTAPERIGRVLIDLPPLAAQRKIAAILSAYDDLIENNRRRIKLLEEMTQRIYREWFVDYRYPGRDNESSTGEEHEELPASWRERHLRELGTITMGQSPPSSAYNTTGDGLPFHQGVGTFGEHFPVLTKYSRVGDRIADPGDVLLSVRAPVGRINIADRKMILGRGLCGVRGEEAPTPFLLYALKHVFQEEDSMGGGSIFNAVTRKDVEGIRILWPGRELVQAFADRAGGTNALIASLTRANSVLRESRDLLLPRLMSGTIDVEDLGISSEEVAA